MSSMEAGNPDLNEWPGQREVQPGSECFYCGERLGQGLLVMWHGYYGDDLWLHPPCAENLAQALYVDAMWASGGVSQEKRPDIKRRKIQ